MFHAKQIHLSNKNKVQMVKKISNGQYLKKSCRSYGHKEILYNY